MKHIKKFNEAIIDYKSENIDNFYNEIKDILRNPNNSMFGFQDIVKIGKKYDIEVVDYDTFYKELSEIDKTTAPPRHGVPVFALANEETGRPRVVFGDMFTSEPSFGPPGFRQGPPRGPAPVTMREIDHIYHVLKHENVHLKQQSKRIGYTKPMPDPKKIGAYFADTDEIMSFSQSIVDMLINMDKVKSLKDGIKKLKDNRLYKDVKRNVSTEVLKKYHKYIYLYLEKEFEDKEMK